MGSIAKSSTGMVSVTYNKAHMSELEGQVFKYSVASFSHLIKRNQQLSYKEFGELIKYHYVAEGKTKLCLEVLEKAAINYRYLCSFKYRNSQSGLIETAEAIVEVEQWSQVKPVLERQMGEQVTDLEFKGFTCVFRKGNFAYDAQRQEVQL